MKQKISKHKFYIEQSSLPENYKDKSIRFDQKHVADRSLKYKEDKYANVGAYRQRKQYPSKGIDKRQEINMDLEDPFNLEEEIDREFILYKLSPDENSWANYKNKNKHSTVTQYIKEIIKSSAPIKEPLYIINTEKAEIFFWDPPEEAIILTFKDGKLPANFKEDIKLSESSYAAPEQLGLITAYTGHTPQRKVLVPVNRLCAHGTSLASVISCLLYTNKQLVPGVKLRLLTGGSSSSGESKGIINLDVCQHSNNKYVTAVTLSEKITQSETHSFCIADGYSTAFLLGDEKSASNVPIIVIGNGVGKGGRNEYGRAPTEWLWQRVDIRLLVVREEDKADILAVLSTLKIHDVKVCTKQEAKALYIGDYDNVPPNSSFKALWEKAEFAPPVAEQEVAPPQKAVTKGDGSLVFESVIACVVMGALIGSIIPGVGTGLGLIMGMFLGGIVAAIANAMEDKNQKSAVVDHPIKSDSTSTGQMGRLLSAQEKFTKDVTKDVIPPQPYHGTAPFAANRGSPEQLPLSQTVVTENQI